MGDRGAFKERLRRLVENSKYTRGQIAEMCGTTEASLSRYLNGERMPKPEILANLATALGTTSDYLLGREDRFSQYQELKALVARRRDSISRSQRRELSDILLGINERIEMEENV